MGAAVSNVAATGRCGSWLRSWLRRSSIRQWVPLFQTYRMPPGMLVRHSRISLHTHCSVDAAWSGQRTCPLPSALRFTSKYPTTRTGHVLKNTPTQHCPSAMRKRAVSHVRFQASILIRVQFATWTNVTSAQASNRHQRIRIQSSCSTHEHASHDRVVQEGGVYVGMWHTTARATLTSPARGKRVDCATRLH